MREVTVIEMENVEAFRAAIEQISGSKLVPFQKQAKMSRSVPILTPWFATTPLLQSNVPREVSCHKMSVISASSSDRKIKMEELAASC